MKKYLFSITAVVLLCVTPFSTNMLASNDSPIETRGKTGFDQT